jgi:hypothetical protein
LVEGKVDASNSPPKILVDNIRMDFDLILPADEKFEDEKSNSTEGKNTSEDLAAVQTNLVAEPAPIEFDDGLDDMPPPPESYPSDWDSMIPASEWQGKQKTSKADQVMKEDKKVVPSPKMENKSKSNSTSEMSRISVVSPEPKPAKSVEPKLSFNKVAQMEDHAPQMITVTLHPSGEAVKDQRRIQRLHGSFISHPGRDHFNLFIKENGHSFMLEFPNDTTHVCVELMNELLKVVGEKDILIEPLLIH